MTKESAYTLACHIGRDLDIEYASPSFDRIHKTIFDYFGLNDSDLPTEPVDVFSDFEGDEPDLSHAETESDDDELVFDENKLHRVVTFRVGCQPQVEEMKLDWKSIQSFVGGIFEYMSLDEEKFSFTRGLDCVYNAEFLFNGSTPNRVVRGIEIRGNFLIAAHNSFGYPESLSDQEIKDVLEESKDFY